MFDVAPRNTMTTPNTANTTEQAAVRAAHATLSSYGPGLPLDALVPARIAALTCGKVRGWSDCFVCIRLDALQAWVASLPRDAAYDLVESEVLMGWFEGDDDDVDGDGDFMSTPSVYGRDSDDDADISDALDHCSRDGFLTIA